MDGTNVGGSKWRPEGGGQIIREVFKHQRLDAKIRPDPKKDAAIDVGLLLTKEPKIALGEVVANKQVVGDDGATLYTVEYRRTLVFEFLCEPKGTTYGVFLPERGLWVMTLSVVAEQRRRRRLTAGSSDE
jgi:hypothetical protein